jgi:excisionase family DNA binding protein
VNERLLVLPVPELLVEQIAERAAEIVLRRFDAGRGRTASPYLTVSEAAEYLRCKPQRVYDLLSARRLTRHKDGRRVLVSRGELYCYLARSGPSRIAPALPPTSQSRSPKGLAA